MTKRNNATGILTILILTTLTGAAQSKPKVVFIGDQFTYSRSSAFAANPNWINEGWSGSVPNNSHLICGAGTSGATAYRFKTDVIDLHPAIVHIMVGVDDANVDDAAEEPFTFPTFLISLQQMIKMAKAANIQIILGIESPEWSDNGQVEPMNSIIANYAAQNNIPVINYADALCSCVGSTGGFGNGFNFATLGSYMSVTPFGALAPTPAGYALMTQLAEATINTLV
jgi:hypothetical protein